MVKNERGRVDQQKNAERERASDRTTTVITITYFIHFIDYWHILDS